MSIKHQLAQMSLLEQRLQIQDLPEETRQRLLQQLASLLAERLKCSVLPKVKEQSHV